MHAKLLEKLNRMLALQLVMEKLVVVVLQTRITRSITALAATGAMLYDVIGFLEHLFNHAVFIGDASDVSCAARHIVVND